MKLHYRSENLFIFNCNNYLEAICLPSLCELLQSPLVLSILLEVTCYICYTMWKQLYNTVMTCNHLELAHHLQLLIVTWLF